MKHVFGINKRLNARRLAERRQEEEEEAAFQREQEMWEREDSRRFEREQRRARQDSGSAVPARRRSFIDVEKANALVEQATQIEKSAPKRGLILFQQALQLYIPALKQGNLGTAENKVMINTQHAMKRAEKLKLEILEKRRGVVDGKLYYNGEMREYAFLDNTACQVPILVDGVTYPSTEHYFQSQKFVGTPIEEKIRTTIDPVEAKKIGTSSSGLRSDWDTAKVDVMLKAISAKFDQHNKLRYKLLDTIPCRLIVAHMKDAYWGNGIYDTGKNVMGKILTTVRDAYLKQGESKKSIAHITLHRAMDADRRRLDTKECLALYKEGIKDLLSAAEYMPSLDQNRSIRLVEKLFERVRELQHIQSDRDIPVIPASLVEFVNPSAPTLPVANVIPNPRE